MSRTEAATRREGALLALAAASALIMRLPAAEHVALPLHLVLLLGCAAVHLAPAHHAVAGLAEAAARMTALGASAAGMRWVGFAGVVIYALYVTGDVRTEAAVADRSRGLLLLLLFLMFLAGVWAVYLSMVTGRPPRPEEEELDGGEVDAMAPWPARVVVHPKSDHGGGQ